MEQTPFELTPEQKGMLASLSRETGKPLPALLAAIAAALEELEERETSNGHEAVEPAVAAAPQLFWQKAIEASQRIPEEDLERLPADLAAQVDHYIYGTPKR
jgi:hypothetical protein